MNRPIVCIGFAEAISAPEVVWSLADSGFQVVAFARKGRRSALRHSRYVRVTEITPPESDFAATLSELQGLLVSCQSDSSEVVVFPLDDSALWLCSRLENRTGWVLAGPHASTAELALDKWIQVLKAKEAGLQVPETQLARTANDVLAQRRTLPVVLKSANAVFVRDGRLQKGRNWICADSGELDQALSQWDGKFPLLVQPFISGTGEGIFGLATSDGVRAWSAHRRIRMMNPHGSGSSACVSQSVSPELKEPVEKFIRQAEWRGLFMVEFLRGQDATAWFVELNGRTWGSTALSRKQGLEYPAWAARLALHTEAALSVPDEVGNQVICRNVGRELMHLLFVLRGPRSSAIKEWPRFWRTLADVMKIGKEDSLYNWRRDDRRVFWSDCWYTISANVFKARN